MKTVLCALNSAYVHKSLAALKLEKAMKGRLEVAEYNINMPLDTVYDDLLRREAEIYAFSSYIWNVEYEVKLAERLKKALGATVIFGGPEAGAEPEAFLSEHPFCDYVIKGEGERSLSLLLSAIGEARTPSAPGIYYRGGGFGVSEHEENTPMPYDDNDLCGSENRLVYYEASRGCYNGCAYCVSSAEAPVNYDLDKVKREIRYLCEKGVTLIKFVDRSFNACAARSEELFRFLSEETGNTRFHCEIAPDRFSETMLTTIEKAPPGKFQFEAGIQSVSEQTLSAVSRRCDLTVSFRNLRRLSDCPSVELHTDLIAGLPLEDKKSFEESFDKTYALGAKQMDVGFLKVLRGTPMREIADACGIVYESYPPYEVIRTPEITARELSDIRRAAHALSRLHNSGVFRHTVAFLEPRFSSPYRMYETLGGILTPGESLRQTFSSLLDYCPEAKDALIRDFLLTDEKKPPASFGILSDDTFSRRCIAYLSQHGELFPEYAALHPGEAYKKLKFFAFDTGTYVAGRTVRRVYKIEL